MIEELARAILHRVYEDLDDDKIIYEDGYAHYETSIHLLWVSDRRINMIGSIKGEIFTSIRLSDPQCFKKAKKVWEFLQEQE